MGGSLPAGSLRYLIKRVVNDASATLDTEQEERILTFCLSKGEPNLYPDLRAANSGDKKRFIEYFDVAQEVVDEVSGATPY